MKSSAGVRSDIDTLPLDAGLEQRIHPLAQTHEIDLAAHAVFDGVLDVDQEIGVGCFGLDIDVQVTGRGWVAAKEPKIPNSRIPKASPLDALNWRRVVSI